MRPAECARVPSPRRGDPLFTRVLPFIRSQEEEMTIWAHPIDVHYTLKGIDGWPRLQLEVWGVDGFGRNELGAHPLAPLGVCL